MAPARLLVDGDVILDNAELPVGGSFFGTGRAELTATAALEAGRPYQLDVEIRHRRTGMGLGGVGIGAQAPVVGDQMVAAVDAAAGADVSIVIVGTNDDWESEGYDRAELELPGRQDELIARVAEVCPHTVVVVNAGSPVAMPWVDSVAAVLMAWFPGQEMGDSLADVLFGDVEPQGRLPVTFPRRLEDTPAFEHHPGRNGVAPYLERRLVGYRWYDTVGREPLFAFGHGLGYADVAIDGRGCSIRSPSRSTSPMRAPAPGQPSCRSTSTATDTTAPTTTQISASPGSPSSTWPPGARRRP